MADFSEFGFTPAPAAPPAAAGNAYADSGFTPAGAPDDQQGEQKAQGAVSKFMNEVWTATKGAIGPSIKRVSGWDDWMKIKDQMAAGDYKGAGTTMLGMASDPGHLGGDVLETSKDQVQRAGQALKEGRYHDAALHINSAIPIVGTAFASGVNGLDRMAKGEHAEGAADVVTNLGLLALPGAVEEAAGRAAPKVSAGLKRAAPVVKAAVDAGTPDIAMGALKATTGAAADFYGVPNNLGTFLGLREGLPQMARGVGKGFKAGRQVIRDRATPPALPAEEVPTPTVRQPGVQDPAAVEPRTPQIDTSTELTPEQEAAIAQRRAAVAPPEAQGPTPAGSTNDLAARAQTPPEAAEGPAPTSTVSKYADFGFTPAEPEPAQVAQPAAQPVETAAAPAESGVSEVPEVPATSRNIPQQTETAAPAPAPVSSAYPQTVENGDRTPFQTDSAKALANSPVRATAKYNAGGGTLTTYSHPATPSELSVVTRPDGSRSVSSFLIDDPGQRGKGYGQELYLAALKDGPIELKDPLHPNLTPDAMRVHQILIDKGYAKRTVDDYNRPSLELVKPAAAPAPIPPAGNTPAAEVVNTPPEPAPVVDTRLAEPAYEHADVPAGGKPDYQAAARTVKGRSLARFLTNPPEGPAITAEEATRMTPAQWQIIAREAGLAAKTPPSPETIQIAIEHMKEIEGRRAQGRLPGSSTEDAGAPPAAAATLPADGERAPEPVQASDAGTRGQGIPVSESVPPSSGTSASATEVEIPGEGRSFPASYRLRELADVRSSHNGLTFQANPEYSLVNDRDYSKPENQGKVIEGGGGKFKPSFHITDNPDAVNGPPVVDSKGQAVGGNGRTMIMQRVYAYNPKGAQAYREMLMKKAPMFGIDPAEVQSMKQPVLVREVADEHLGKAADAITDLNKTGTAALTPAERAMADSRRVSTDTLEHVSRLLDDAGPDATLQKVLSSDAGAGVLERLFKDKILSRQETAAYIADGKLTPAAKQRIAKLMLGRFFRDPAQLDTTPGPIVNKLERLAAPVAKLETAGSWNLMPKLQEALDLIDEARAHGTRNLSELLKQTGLLGESRYTADALTLGKALQRFTGRQLNQAVKDYAATAEFAKQHADAKAGLFGADVPGVAPTPAEAFEAAFRPGKSNPPASSSPTSGGAPPAASRPRKTVAESLGDQLKQSD